MKDLKHLIFFENLLQDAQNELVTQAVNDGPWSVWKSISSSSIP